MSAQSKSRIASSQRRRSDQQVGLKMGSSREPHSPRRILLCAIGLTAQVVTETVWALAQRTPPWRPDEIHIVTTTFALATVRSTLQSPKGQLAKLLGFLPPVTIHVPNRNGPPMVFEPLRTKNDWDHADDVVP